MKLTIVSTDGHAGPRVEAYRPYLESRYHDALDKLIEEEDEFLDATIKIATFSDQQLALIDPAGIIASGGTTGAWDLDRRIREMDREGVAAEVFLQGHQFASAPWFGAQNRAHPEELRMAGVRAFNRWQADLLKAANGRLIGVAEHTPVRDLDEVVREVRWAGQNGFRAVTFPGVTDPDVVQPGFQDPFWDPFWEACADYELALLLHVGLGTRQGLTFELFIERSRAVMAGSEYNRDAPERRISAMAHEMAGDKGDDPRLQDFFALNYSPRKVAWELMVGGVFDRYPSLKYVPTEARADWVPATLAYMDQRYERGGTPLKRRPSEYWRDHCFVGASFIHRAEIEERHAIGVTNLMFGRDYPHPEGTWPNTLDWLRDAFAGVPENEAKLILSDNAIRCYGLDAKALAAVADRVGPDVADVLGDHSVDPLVLAEFEKRGGYAKPAPPLITNALDEIFDNTLAPAAS